MTHDAPLQGSDPATPVERSTWRDWLAQHLGLQIAQRFDVYLSVASSARLGEATYWAEIILSAGIATLGLTLGSPAVIIGAMLISPLMGPIMATGLALATGDFVLAVRGLINIVLSSLTGVFFSTLLVVFLPFREMTTEIASRTHPNTLDLIIALFSGAVGALAVCKSVRGIATSIPGVAIAVALMPPLCVTGYGVGILLMLDRTQGLALIRGGGLLYVTNLVAITFASMLVFLLLHIDDEQVRSRIRERRRQEPESARVERLADRLIPGSFRRVGSLPARLFLVSLLMVAVFFPLKRSFDALSVEIRQRQELNQAHKAATRIWDELFARTTAGAPRSYIERLDVSEHDDRLIIDLRALVTQPISPEEREQFGRLLSHLTGRRRDRMDIHLIEIPTSEYQVARSKIEPPPPAAAPPESPGKRFAAAAEEIVGQLRETSLPQPAVLADQSVSFAGHEPAISLTYLAPQSISEDARTLIAGDLARQLDLANLRLDLDWIPSRIDVAFIRKTIDQPSADSLATLAKTLGARPRLAVQVGVHPGDRDARARIDAVKSALTAAGIDPSRITEGGEADQAGHVVVTVTLQPGS